MSPSTPSVVIHTDGACRGNPGPGGWGAVLSWGPHHRELSGGERETTNNRMELMAAIQALGVLKHSCEVVIYTDSQYLRKGVTEWIPVWKKNRWRTANRQPVKNRDLWERLDALSDQHRIRWKWVKGHAGNPGNERADRLANQGLQRLEQNHFEVTEHAPDPA